ncbi:MAG: NAD(P)/FAD-dependent oxidoreductase [Spirochaetales bacterium]|nr:NAD(P)/FAD-dependent oxidoreductase [Spirochaetales bacterium]
MKVAIIGSGAAGLTVGAYLAAVGHQVTVFEQHGEIGGVTATVGQDGFSWDLGPLLLEGFGPAEAGTKILRSLGVVHRVGSVRSDRDIVFPDFSLIRPSEYRGPAWRREYLKTLFPADADGLDGYYEVLEAMTDLAVLARDGEMKARPGKLKRLLTMKKLFQPLRQYQDWTAERLMDHFFSSEKLKAVFTAILADMVVKPSEFPALGVPLLNLETAFDARIPLFRTAAGVTPEYRFISGGCGSLVQALASVLQEHGGKILAGKTVSAVRTAGRRAIGVAFSDDSFFNADLVIATGGVRETFLHLLDGEPLKEDFRKKVESLIPMESVMMVHLGIDFDPSVYQRSPLCYYYGIYDINEGVEKCRRGDYHGGADGFVVYVPSEHSPSMAPEGRHAVTIYTIAPNILNEGTWEERRELLADALVAAAERYIPGLKKGTVTRLIMTPADFRRRTAQKHHSFGGLSPVMGQKSVPCQTPVKNLYFAGSQSESGGGILPVMKGAVTLSGMIDRRCRRL